MSNARIDGENVTQLTNLNVTGKLYHQGVLLTPNAYLTVSRTTDLALGTSPVEVPFETIGIQKGIDVSGTDITFTEAGVYQVSMEFSLEKTSVGGTNSAVRDSRKQH